MSSATWLLIGQSAVRQLKEWGHKRHKNLPQRETRTGRRSQWVWAVAVKPDDLVEGKTDSWKLSSERHT